MKTWETIKVFESFAGIGTQRMALKNQGIEHEVVAIAEVDEYALLSYHAIHTADIEVKEASEEEMQRYMEEKNIPLDPKGKRKILKNKRLKDLYVASVASNNLGDISKITDGEIPRVDLFTYSFPCFTKDNLVLTEEGYKPINKVAVGDKVLTHNNTYEKVVKTFDNGVQPTVKVKAMGIDEIVTTPNHKFYVREKYKEWNNDRRSYDRLFKEPQWKEIKDVTKDYYLGMAINQKSEIPEWDGITFYWDDGRKPRHKNELRELMDSQDFWWIIGRYLADGWTRTQGGIVFGIGKDKTSEFEDRLGKVFNYSLAEEESVVKYHVPLKELSKFVEQFGKGAANKKLSKSVLDLPIDLLENFLKGYFSGDGCLTNGYWKASSVSRELMLGIGQAIMKVYKRPYSLYKNIRPKTTIIEGRTVNQKDTYSLSFKKEAKKQDNAFYENGYVWIPFDTVEDTGNENVYDIEVNNAHSFTIQNVIVHNCQDISLAGKQKGLDKNSGTRSSLLWECERIIETVKPKYLLMENVKALVNKNNKPQFDIWLEYLEELGYKNFWQVLNAKDYGIPQNRERVFVVSILDENADYKFPAKIPLTLKLKDILEDNVDDSYYLSQEQVDRITFSTYNIAKTRIQEKEYSDTLCARDFKDPKCVVVGGVGEKNFGKQYRQGNRVYDSEGVAACLQASPVGGAGGKSSLYKVKQIGQYDTPTRKNSNRYRVYDKETINPSLTTMGGDNLEPHVIDNDDLEDYELVGTIYSGASKRFMGKPMKGLSKTLKATTPDTSVVYKKNNNENCTDNYRVRKLTPNECWRLMGIADEDFKKANKVVSNSQLYKQAGNAIVVDVLEGIFKQLFNLDENNLER